MRSNQISFGSLVKTWAISRLGLDKRFLKSGRSGRVTENIIQTARARTRKDIDSWRKALQRAEHISAPRRDLLLDLYADVILDAHISGIIEHSRLNKLLAQEFRVLDIKKGEEDEELTMLLNASWFFRFIELVLESRWYGHSLIEFPSVDKDIAASPILVPRRHIVPEFGVFLKNLSDSKGIAYRDTPFMDYMVEVGRDHDLGLLLKAAPQFLYKKNASIAWSEYTELFGMPIRIGKTNTRNDEDLNRMEDMLKSLGSAAYGVFQDGEEIEFIESQRTDAYRVYDKLLERANSELSKLFLGQTMTTEVGQNGSRSQAEVHERVGDDVTAADRRFIEAVVNDNLFPMLIKHGWKLEGKRFEYPEMKGIDILWSRVRDIAPHVMLDISWLQETFGVHATEQKLTKNDIEAGKTEKEGKKKANRLVKKVDELYNGHFHD